MHIQTLSITLFLAAAIGAAEKPQLDLRFELAGVGGTVKEDWIQHSSAGNGTAEDAYNTKDGGRVNLYALATFKPQSDAPVRLMAGLGLSGTSWSDTADYGGGDTCETDLGFAGVDGYLGFGFETSEHLRLEALGYLGVGSISTTYKYPSAPGENMDASGAGYEVGFRVGAVYTFDCRFQVGAFAGYSQVGGSVDYSGYSPSLGATYSSTNDITIKGGQFGIGIGYRIN